MSKKFLKAPIAFYKEANPKYLIAYISFIKLEIPSILQIITLLTLFSIFGNNWILNLILIFSVYFLSKWYLSEKLLIFINNEMKYYIEEKDRQKNKEELLRSFLIYNLLVSIIISCILGGISGIFVTFPLFNSIIDFIKFRG